MVVDEAEPEDIVDSDTKVLSERNKGFDAFLLMLFKKNKTKRRKKNFT